MDTLHNGHESKCGSKWKLQKSSPSDRFTALVRIRNEVNTIWKMTVCRIQILQGVQVLLKSCICVELMKK